MEINAHTFFCDFCEWWNEAVCSIHLKTAFLPTRQDPQPIRTMIIRALGIALSEQIDLSLCCLLTPLHWFEAFQLLFYKVVFLQVRS